MTPVKYNGGQVYTISPQLAGIDHLTHHDILCHYLPIGCEWPGRVGVRPRTARGVVFRGALPCYVRALAELRACSRSAALLPRWLCPSCSDRQRRVTPPRGATAAYLPILCAFGLACLCPSALPSFRARSANALLFAPAAPGARAPRYTHTPRALPPRPEAAPPRAAAHARALCSTRRANHCRPHLWGLVPRPHRRGIGASCMLPICLPSALPPIVRACARTLANVSVQSYVYVLFTPLDGHS